MRIGALFTTTALSTTVFFAGPALAQSVAPSSLPAVSAPNAKFSAFGGVASGQGLGGVGASFAVPFGERFGAQFDGLVGGSEDSVFYGGAAHFFWRDPAKGLLGLYGSYVTWDSLTTTGSGLLFEPALFDTSGAEIGKLGIEAEAYIGRVSLEGLLAWQFGSFEGVTGKATLAYYPTDHARLDVGLRYTQGVGAIAGGGLEWQPKGHRFSLFGNGGVTLDDGSWSAQGGIKVYLGAPDKPLIRRHREDDPEPELELDLFETLGPAYCANDGLFPVFVVEDGLTYCDDGLI